MSGELSARRLVYLAVVVGHQKGSPGTAGAQLLLTEAGEVLGTIGGGIMEARLLEEAGEALKKGPAQPALRVLHHKATDAFETSGLICGGAQSLVTVVLGSESQNLVSDVVDWLRDGKNGVLLISNAGLSLGEEDLSQPSAFLEGSDENWTAGIGLLNRHRVLIVGCGHCGSALARQMAMLGFNVEVVEPRMDLASVKALNEAVTILQKPFSEASHGIDHVRLTFAVVMTPSYPDDVDVLASLLPQAFPFIGVMGSPVKLKKIKDELFTRGFSESHWSRLTAPVGLPIESDTPAEIAVSIAAQILQQTKQHGF